MIEVEVKARCSPEIKDKIIELGGELIGVENHLDLYFNSPFHDFASTDEALRIREKEEGFRFTYKGPKLDSETKSRREITVKIDDFEALEEILKLLGFTRAAVVKKQRTKYSLEGAILALDEVKGLGTFLEVELSGGEDWTIQKKAILEIMDRMGLKKTIRKSYLELLMDVWSDDTHQQK
ncbi:MAG: class IV adenylate cyclase [Methanotrichaceae archaeon]